MSSHPCSGCKADLKWSPGSGALECPYCGTRTEVEGPADIPVPEHIVEYDLDAALASVPRGWGAQVAEFRCSQCGAYSAVEPHVTVTTCAFCGTSQMEVQPVDEDVIRPESLLPFSFEKKRARQGFLGWVKGLWFRPNDLKTLAKLDGLKGIYVPVFTFDMKSSTDWNAQAGFYYYVTVSDGKGGTRQERRTRWEWRSGNVRRRFDDWMVVASVGMTQDLFNGLLPYDTAALVPYDNRYLSGFVAERYQRDLQESWTIGRAEMENVIDAAVRRDIPGDTYRMLTQSTQTWDETFKHCLVPVWISAYRYKEKTFHYVVNGVTGKMNGTAPYSWIKISLAILSVVGVLGALYWYETQS